MASHLHQQRRVVSRSKVIRRRRATVLVALLVLVAGAVAACNAVSSAVSHPKGHGGTTASSVPKETTTTTLPASFGVGIHTFHWNETGAGITHVGPTGVALAGRVLTTEVRYPTLAASSDNEDLNARPTVVGGPYPVIVFAHGFETEPSSYQELLDTWVAAGFVVVSPVFPDESAAAVAAAGGMTNAGIASTLESDVYSEPADIAYVLKQLESISSDPWGSNLKGVLDMSDVGLAGQSDGANVVAGLAYSHGMQKLYGELPVAPKAVVVMSGVPWGNQGTYAASASSPALLQIQSDADGCVSPTQATYLFGALQAGLTSKWWVTLLNADHLGPYEGATPWAPIVDTVTTKFLELELNWRSASLTGSSVISAGTASGVAAATTTVTPATVPQVSMIPGC